MGSHGTIAGSRLLQFLLCLLRNLRVGEGGREREGKGGRRVKEMERGGTD